MVSTNRFRGTAAAVIMAAGMVLAAPAANAEDSGLSDAQSDAIETMIRDYIMEHPEVIIESLRAMEARNREAEAQRQAEALTSSMDQILGDPGTPVMGNPEGDVVLVEFFDYQCGYCKRMFVPLMDTVTADGNVRLVMKELPILGPMSLVAAKAALAADRQGLYAEFHTAMMERRGQLSEEAIYATAAEVGLDVAALREDMKDPEIAAALTRNYDLSQQIGINGTPAMVIDGQLVPGAVDKDTIEQLVADARDGS